MIGYSGPLFGGLFGPLFSIDDAADGKKSTITKYVEYSDFRDLQLVRPAFLPIKHLGETFDLVLISREGEAWTVGDIRLYYWLPSNTTDAPSGYIAASKVAAVGEVLTAEVSGSIITEPSTEYDNYRFQLIEKNSGLCWMPPIEVKVINRGSVY